MTPLHKLQQSTRRAPTGAGAGACQFRRTVSLLWKIIVIPQLKLLQYSRLVIADSRRQSSIISVTLCSIDLTFQLVGNSGDLLDRAGAIARRISSGSKTPLSTGRTRSCLDWFKATPSAIVGSRDRSLEPAPTAGIIDKHSREMRGSRGYVDSRVPAK